MIFRMEHNCIYTTDLERAIEFYNTALQLTIQRRKHASDREIAFLANDLADQQLEVIQMNGRSESYELGENSTHLAFRTDDIAAAAALHKQMGCFSHELPEFGVYFIKDPDGYFCEIMPTR